MKKINLLLLALFLFAGNAFGQVSYNPFTQNIHFEPEPTPAGFECGTIHTVAFTQGLTTSENATQWQSSPLKVVICLTGFSFNGAASSVASGSYSANFDWAYDNFAPNCIIGTQNQTLIGTGGNPIFPDPASSGPIKLSLIVPDVAPINSLLGVNVSLQVPSYMAQFNSVPDDNEATQTQTYCPLKIKGTIYHDIDSNTNVNGIPTATAAGVQLYVNLIAPNGNVLAVTPVLSNGNYEFLNVVPNTTYTVLLSIQQGTIGSPAPATDLPGTWVNTGEDCCDKVGNDGNPDGINIVPVTDYTKINVDFGIKDPNATGLGVVLTDFFVSEYNCQAFLSWTTSQEENTSHAEVFRKDGPQGVFRRIAIVQSAGNSTTQKIYSYLDKDVSQGTTYEYQLKFVDLDGHSTNSDIKALTLDCTKDISSLNIFPNPATSRLNILYITEGDNFNLSIVVTDITGRKIMKQSQLMSNGVNLMTLDINSIASGNYVLHYKDDEGLTVGAIKFTKH